MAQKPITMSEIKQVLQLHADGVAIKEIARRTGMSKNTVKKYIRNLEMHLPVLHNRTAQQSPATDKKLADIAYNNDTSTAVNKRTEALLQHFKQADKELKKTGVTRQLLWTEYITEHPEGYQYSQYCNLFRKFRQDSSASFHWDHHPAEFIQADFAGDRLFYVNKQTGELIACQTFVAVLPFSGLTFCYCVPSQKTQDFAICIREMLKYFGGVPMTILVDNFKTAVKKADRYEPSFTRLCHQLSEHYYTTFSATRPASPSDKGMVERSVNIIYQWVYAPLRKETFTSLEGLNKAVRGQLKLLNNKPYKGGQQSRNDIFQRSESALLKSLPERHFELLKIKRAKVQRNYAVQLMDNQHYYTVPYQLVGKDVEVYFNTKIVEVYYNHERVAMHIRSSTEPKFNRIDAHMPKNHQAMVIQKGWTVEQLLQKASFVGPYTRQLADRILHSSIYPEQNFKACNAMIMLKNAYNAERLEAACKHASIVAHPTLKMVRAILKTGQDKVPDLFEDEDKPIAVHNNIRGKDYYC